MSLPDISFWTPAQKGAGIAAALAVAAAGGGTFYHLNKDVFKAKSEASKHFAQAARQIEPRMETGSLDWNMRY